METGGEFTRLSNGYNINPTILHVCIVLFYKKTKFRLSGMLVHLYTCNYIKDYTLYLENITLDLEIMKLLIYKLEKSVFNRQNIQNIYEELRNIISLWESLSDLAPPQWGLWSWYSQVTWAWCHLLSPAASTNPQKQKMLFYFNPMHLFTYTVSSNGPVFFSEFFPLLWGMLLI